MTKTVDRHIRIQPRHWKRIQDVARERGVPANQTLVDLALEALDSRQWPRAGLEILLLRSCMFTAQAVARDMIAAGRENEVKQIEKSISTVAPQLPSDL